MDVMVIEVDLVEVENHLMTLLRIDQRVKKRSEKDGQLMKVILNPFIPPQKNI